MSKSDIIKTSSRDELTSIIDKVITHDSDKVFLMVPDNAYIAQNILNFRLLKREAETVDKKIIIISENPRIQSLATRAGLGVQDRVELATRLVVGKRDRRSDLISDNTREVVDIVSPEKIHVLDELDEKDKPQDSDSKLRNLFKKEPVEKEPVESKHFSSEKFEPIKDASVVEEVRKVATDKKSFSFSTSSTPYFEVFKKIKNATATAWQSLYNAITKHPIKFLTAIVFIAVAIGFLFLATVVLPRATVVLYPKTLQDSINFSLIADSNISREDYAKGIIPAQIIEEKQENNFSFEATGTAQIEDRATGTIRVYNEYSSAPQTLLETTRFLSANGKLFRTTQTVTVPGAQIEGGQIVASSITVPVIANEAGKEYNINPTAFSIPAWSGDPRYTKFYGKSKQQFQGGFKGRAVVATKEDLDKAKEKIEKEFVVSVEDAIKEKIPENLVVLEDSLESNMDVLEFSVKEGDIAETFTARAVVVASVVLIRQSDILDAIAYNFINSTKYNNEFDLSDDRNIEYIVKEVDFKVGYAEFALNIEQLFVRKLNAEQVVEDIKGKNEVEVRRILSGMEELEKAQLRFWPFWVSRMPSNEEDINVEVQFKDAEFE